MNDTLYSAATLIIPLVFAIVFHEVAHGWAALALGDPTAREERRLSLNPLRHIDPFGTVVLPAFLALIKAPVFGWAKPVPVDKRRLANPRFGMMLVALAGPGTNLLLAGLAAVALGLLARATAGSFPSDWIGVARFVTLNLNAFILINIFLALFNLLPVPPFDGSHVVEALLPRRAANAYERLRPFGLPLLIVLLLVVPMIAPRLGIVQRLVLPPVEWTADRYYELARKVAGG